MPPTPSSPTPLQNLTTPPAATFVPVCSEKWMPESIEINGVPGQPLINVMDALDKINKTWTSTKRGQDSNRFYKDKRLLQR